MMCEKSNFFNCFTVFKEQYDLNLFQKEDMVTNQLDVLF